MGISIDDATAEEWNAARHAANALRGPISIDALNASLDRPFGEIDLSTRAYVFLLHQTGKVEMGIDGGMALAPRWLPSHTYQVRAVEKPKTKPSIDWSHIAPEYKWLARDGDGFTAVYDTKPVASERDASWRAGGTPVSTRYFASYVPGDCDWKDSLVARPAGV